MDGHSVLAVYVMGPDKLCSPSTKTTIINAVAWVITRPLLLCYNVGGHSRANRYILSDMERFMYQFCFGRLIYFKFPKEKYYCQVTANQASASKKTSGRKARCQN